MFKEPSGQHYFEPIVIKDFGTFSVSALRPDDFLTLRFQFINFSLIKFFRLGSFVSLVSHSNKDSFIIVHLPPQSIAEESITNGQNTNLPLQSMLANESRLAFKAPYGAVIPYSLEGLLKEIGRFRLVVSPAAKLPANTVRFFSLVGWKTGDVAEKNPTRKSPNPTETSIEAPFRLIISPNSFTKWEHSAKPVISDNGRVELWHTRLGANQMLFEDSGTPGLFYFRNEGLSQADLEKRIKSVRALKNDKTSPLNFDTSLKTLTANDAENRNAIVTNSTNNDPILVEKLHLSSLGASFNFQANWNVENGLSSWLHRAMLGRDNYVRIVTIGYVLPFGHRASLITVTERKLHLTTPGQPAILFKREFLVITEPIKYYPLSGTTIKDEGLREQGQMPFKSIEILTTVTPNIKGSNGWIQTQSGADYKFPILGVDLEGNRVKFEASLMFVTNSKTSNEMGEWNWTGSAFVLYNNETNKDQRQCNTNGQSIALARSGNPGDTSFETNSISFKALKMKNESPPFYPVLEKAKIVSEAVRAMTGNDEPVTVKYNKTFLEHGFGSTNQGGIFVELDSTSSTDMNFDGKGDRVGGLVQPNFSVTGFSRKFGPVGVALTNDANGDSAPNDASALINGLGDAMIFGVFKLKDILNPDDFEKAVPKILAEKLDAATDFYNRIKEWEMLLESVRGDNLITSLQNLSISLPDDSLVENYADQMCKLIGLAGKVSGIITGIENIIGMLPDIEVTAENSLADSFANLLPKELDLSVLETGLRSIDTSSLHQDVQSQIQAAQELIDSSANAIQKLKKHLEFFQKVESISSIFDNLNALTERKVSFTWEPKLSSFRDIFIADNAKLTIESEIQLPSALDTMPAFNSICTLSNFQINLTGKNTSYSFLSIDFNKIQFTSLSGKKPDIDVVINGITFTGVLAFVENLKEYIPADGFSDPPALEITAKGIEASFSQPIPNITLGMFALSNMSLSAALTIPFFLSPLGLRFNFCERHNPFQLTVSGFGGGGFFGLQLDPGGVELLEASLEFGACAAMDFGGIASGSVSVMGGVYFSLETQPEGRVAALAAFIRINGEVDVLGLITASIELYLELAYNSTTKKCVGQASIKVEVKVAFFSKCVTVECERTLAGSSGDPSFSQIMGPYSKTQSGEVEAPALPGDHKLSADIKFPWREYCQAFAEEA